MEYQHQQQLKDNLEELLLLIKPAEILYYPRSLAEEGNKFVIEYGGPNGVAHMLEFLERMKDGNFLTAHEIRQIKDTLKKGEPVCNIYGEHEFGFTKNSDGSATVHFTPYGNLEVMIEDLQKSIKIAQSRQYSSPLVSEHRKFKPEIKLPETAQKISNYLTEILRTEIPGSEPHITYTKNETGAKFTVTINGGDAQKLDGLIARLNKTFSNHAKSDAEPKVVRTFTEKPGFSIAEDPVILLGYMKMNDPEKFKDLMNKRDTITEQTLISR